MKTVLTVGAALLVLAGAVPAEAGEEQAGWEWLAESNEIETQGAFWNDRYGDGKDRWKSGGITQSYVFPERIFHGGQWLEGRASALEFNVRAHVMTPDDTANTGVDPDDRPYAQYAALGVHFRSIARPEPLGHGFTFQVEDRIGVEVGWQGEPLPLFDVQDSLHEMTGTEGSMGNPSNVIDGEVLVNLDGRRSWRLHRAGEGRDVELAPFVQGSLGMREVSLRVGADMFVGSALEGRTWGSDPATGAVIAGHAPRRLPLDRLSRRRRRLRRLGRLPRRRLRRRRAGG